MKRLCNRGGGEEGQATGKSVQRVSFPNLEKPAIVNVGVSAGSPNLPIGGTTGLCHQSSEAIGEAATWYREHRDTCERPIVPALKRRFGLTSAEAVFAMREAAR